MNLTIIKPKTMELKVDNQTLKLKYTLKSFSYLEEEFGSVNTAIDLFNEKDCVAVIKFIEAGLLHCAKKPDIQKIVKKADLIELIVSIAQCIQESLSSDFGFDKEFDWHLLYFIAKPALNFSDEEFWQATPKKILTMLRMMGEVKGLIKSDHALSANEAVNAFMSW